MDTSFYREFLVLVDTLNFWEASSRLFMNESSLSKHIRKMEKELGVKLFDRSSRKVELTHYGKMMIPFAEKIVEAEMESRDAIRNAVEMENGVLMVGILPDATNYQLTDVLVRFSDAYPDAVIKALDNDTLELKLESRGHLHVRTVTSRASDHAGRAVRGRGRQWPGRRARWWE